MKIFCGNPGVLKKELLPIVQGATHSKGVPINWAEHITEMKMLTDAKKKDAPSQCLNNFIF